MQSRYDRAWVAVLSLSAACIARAADAMYIARMTFPEDHSAGRAELTTEADDGTQRRS